MKRIILLWLFFFNTDVFSQTRQNTVVAEIDFNRPPAWLQRSDTIRATLLITIGHMTIAHEKPGYVVFRSKDTLYLDDRKIQLKPPVTVWRFIKKP